MGGELRGGADAGDFDGGGGDDVVPVVGGVGGGGPGEDVGFRGEPCGGDGVGGGGGGGGGEVQGAEDAGWVDVRGEEVVGEVAVDVGVEFGEGPGRDDGDFGGVGGESVVVVGEDREARPGADGRHGAIAAMLLR